MHIHSEKEENFHNIETVFHATLSTCHMQRTAFEVANLKQI